MHPSENAASFEESYGPASAELYRERVRSRPPRSAAPWCPASLRGSVSSRAASSCRSVGGGRCALRCRGAGRGRDFLVPCRAAVQVRLARVVRGQRPPYAAAEGVGVRTVRHAAHASWSAVAVQDRRRLRTRRAQVGDGAAPGVVFAEVESLCRAAVELEPLCDGSAGPINQLFSLVRLRGVPPGADLHHRPRSVPDSVVIVSAAGVLQRFRSARRVPASSRGFGKAARSASRGRACGVVVPRPFDQLDAVSPTHARRVRRAPLPGARGQRRPVGRGGWRVRGAGTGRPERQCRRKAGPSLATW